MPTIETRIVGPHNVQFLTLAAFALLGGSLRTGEASRSLGLRERLGLFRRFFYNR